MEIERINENTVKFFLSYKDIEERGFTREEVWYNRDKSEELFWEMMDEINEESEFEVEGPLWIQVHAMNSGIEVTVTRAQNSEDGQLGESPFMEEDGSKGSYQPEGEGFDEIDEINPDEQKSALDWFENTFYFKEFEDIIRLSNRIKSHDVKTSLYSFEDSYYLHVLYDVSVLDHSQKLNIISVLSEFATRSNMTIHRLQEYGNVVMDSDVFSQVKKYFGTP